VSLRPSTDGTSRFESVARLVLATAGASVALAATLPLLLVALPFWVVRVLTSAGGKLSRRLQPRETPWEELVRFEPEVGWIPLPGLDTHARAGHLFHLSTDEEGWRGPTSLHDADIVVVGDSFAFGYGASDRDLFTEQVPGLSAKGVGANGYSMVQGLLWMERLGERLRDRTVVWIVYYGNDLYENLVPNQGRYRMPFVRESATGRNDWQVVTEHVGPEPWPFHRDRWYDQILAEICSRTFVSDRAFRACEYLIGRGRDLCREAGARLALVGNPDVDMVRPGGIAHLRERSSAPGTFDVGRPDRELASMCERLEVPFYALSSVLTVRDHLPWDCHWSPQGHRKVARVLARIHRDLAPSPGETPATGTSEPAVARVGG